MTDITRFIGVKRSALRVTDQGGGVGWLRSVGQVLIDDPRLTKVVGSVETGMNGQLHWQLSIEGSVDYQSIALTLKRNFQELKGIKGQKGQKYSCVPMRSEWSRSVAYCLKDADLDDRKEIEGGSIILKGESIEFLSEMKAKLPKDCFSVKTTYLGKLTDACHGLENKRDICRRIIEWHVSNDRVIPNKWRRNELVDHVRTILSEDRRDAIEELVESTFI